MRRKWLLLTVLAIFMLSGTISGYFLQHSDTYTVDNTVLNRPEEETIDGNTVARVQVPILSEEEASALAVAEASASLAEIARDEGVDDADAAVSTMTEEPTSRPDEIDVPLAGQTAQDDINEAWRTLFNAWQQATWGIFGAITVALLVVLFARWAFLRRLS